MRKSRGILARSLAAVMVVWLALVFTEPLPIDACPMHGVHAMHGAHAMSHSAAGHHGAPKEASHQCTCIGDCTAGGASFAAIPPSIAGPAARIARIFEPEHATAVVAGRGLREHTLPPSNGPPDLS